jgi:ABC-2 type transport system permease protein
VEKLFASVIKETKIIFRDREALLILFAMPLAFVLIMSLALQNVFKEKGGGAIFNGVVLDLDGGKVGEAIVKGVSSIKNINVKKSEDNDEARMKKDIAAGAYEFGIIIPKGATGTAGRGMGGNLPKAGLQSVKVRLLVDPAMRADHRGLIASVVSQTLMGVELQLLGDRLTSLASALPFGNSAVPRSNSAKTRIFADLKAENISGEDAPMPTAVQQSVPGWSLFAMFFIVIPLSVAFIKERQQGSLVRIMSMPVPAWTIMLGKAIPFFFINQAQLILMLLVGMYIVPLLGGDSLVIGNSPGALALLACGASIAAVSYGLMVSTFCKSIEQASTFGGTSAIIFGALGGVMVPKFEMPLFMQKLTVISPMSWGLEGFIDIFVRKGNIRDVMPETLALVAFAFVCASIAVWRFRTISSR